MSACASNERFHTVVIRGDLPTITKQYAADKPMDLPEADYWIRGVIEYVAGDRWSSKIQHDRFKMQHTISNGPCEQSYGFF
jgi:hypothetical protein